MYLKCQKLVRVWASGAVRKKEDKNYNYRLHQLLPMQNEARNIYDNDRAARSERRTPITSLLQS
jgi:hypothetical protein